VNVILGEKVKIWCGSCPSFSSPVSTGNVSYA